MRNSYHRAFFRYLGPGIITAALIFGPGSLTITSKLGAGYQYDLLWLILLSMGFMILFTVLSAKFGLVSRMSMLAVLRLRYGRFMAILTGIGLSLVALSFQTGNAIGAGLAAAGLFETGPAVWILCFSASAIFLLLFRSFYRILEKIMIGLVLVMIFSFLVTLLIASPEWGRIITGLLPTIPAGSGLLSIALVASSFSLAGAFFQSYLVQEKDWKPEEKSTCIREGVTGIVILGFISALVLITAGSVLYTSGVEVSSAADMGKVLEPLFGEFAFTIFMVGLFAASFSSLIGNATLGGTLLADTLSLDINLQNWPVRILIMIIIALGALIAVLYRELGLQLIIIAQGLTILMAPLLAGIILLFSTSKKIMGSLRSPLSVRILGIAGLLVLLFLVAGYIILLFG